jgi:hypothetical protein
VAGAMSTRTLFFVYMTLVGVVSGAIIVAAPQVTEFWVKPYFWALLAVAVFDAAIFLISKKMPAAMLPMNARVIGFVVGAVLMVAIPSIAGTQAKFF